MQQYRNDRFSKADRVDHRTPAQVDVDRLLYAINFARLAEITQTVSADHGYVFHNRLTHSLKVAQLAKRMAQALVNDKRLQEAIGKAGGLDPDVAEAAGIAHDLGHPPFGHIAEEVLQEESEDLDGSFEGNAQSFRLVTRLSVSDAVENDAPIFRGLNLTRATLNAILKYPWYHKENNKKPRKWGAYRCDEDFFKFAREGELFEGTQVKSLEAEIMDWADDITYAVHDVVDFYCAGRIPLERFFIESETATLPAEFDIFFSEVFERKDNNLMNANRKEYEEAFKSACALISLSVEARYEGSGAQRSALWQMMTTLIARYVGELTVPVPSERDENKLVRITPAIKREVDMLKQLTWHYVILHNDLAIAQHGQKEMVRTTFKELNKHVFEKNSHYKLFPKFYEELLKNCDAKVKQQEACNQQKKRLVVDYVSSMTERELAKMYKSLTGHF